MSLNDFFARKKGGKKAAKPVNLNVEDSTSKKETATKDEKEWKQEEKVEDKKDPVSPSKTVAQLEKEDTANVDSKSWNMKKAATGDVNQGLRYTTPFNAPGAVTETKFPTLEKTTANNSTAVYEPKKQGGKNVFAGLSVGDDSDEEREMLAKPALVSKTKGVAIAEFGKSTKEELDEEAKQKKAEELAKKKAEKEEKRRALLGKDKPKKKVDPNEAIMVMADFSKFEYGRFDPSACEEKYAGREKLIAA